MDNDECEEVEKLFKKLNKIFLQNEHSETIPLSIQPIELVRIIQGLIVLKQSHLAEEYIKNSVKDEKRWQKVSEIMLLKEPGKTLNFHGVDELICYKTLVESGMKPNDASIEVFKKFKFASEDSCDKWIQRQIAKYKKSTERNKYKNLFFHLPSPNTTPR